MVITELIRTQAFESGVMFLSGLGLGALYSLFLYIKGYIRKPGIEAAAEVAFWIFAAFYVSGFLRYASHGAINFHNFLFLTFGTKLWQRLFYGKIKY